LYTTGWAEDSKHITEVKNPRLIETGYQSSQLKLWILELDEWLLASRSCLTTLRGKSGRGSRRFSNFLCLTMGPMLLPLLLAYKRRNSP
jgi:hypothetical protein